MTTRAMICEECDDAIDIGSRIACPYEPTPDGKPSCCSLRRAWSDPNATCKHPAGNRWNGAELVVLPVARTSTVAGDWLTERVRWCKGNGDARPRCECHVDPWECRPRPGIRINLVVLKAPGFACPIGKFGKIEG